MFDELYQSRRRLKGKLVLQISGNRQNGENLPAMFFFPSTKILTETALGYVLSW